MYILLKLELNNFLCSLLHLTLCVPIEPNKDIQKLLKPSSSGDLAKELFQRPAGEEESGLSGHTASLLHIAEKRREYHWKCYREAATENVRVLIFFW